jgi:hypothetical protein
VAIADSWKSEKARRLAEAEARRGESGFMSEDSWVIARAFLRLLRTLLKNRREMRRFGDVGCVD